MSDTTPSAASDLDDESFDPAAAPAAPDGFDASSSAPEMRAAAAIMRVRNTLPRSPLWAEYGNLT